MSDEQAAPYATAYPYVELTDDFLYEDDAFKRPRLFRPSQDVERPTYFHGECDRVIGELQEIKSAKHIECIENMRKNKVDGASGCLNPTFPFQYNDFVHSPPLFECAENLKVFTRSLKVGVVDMELEAYPYRMLAEMSHMLEGSALVLVLPPSTLLDWPNVSACIADCSLAVLRKCPAFLLHEGWSLWVPYGHTPVVCGLPPVCKACDTDMMKAQLKEDCNSQKLATVMYGLSLSLNVLDLGVNKDIDTEVSGLWAKERQYWFRNLKINDGAASWANKLVPEKVEEKETPPTPDKDASKKK